MVNRERRGYELKTSFLGRYIRPFHLAITFATGVIAYNLYSGGILAKENTIGPAGFCGCIYAAHILATIASIAVIFLIIGWWKDKDWFSEWGLLLALGVWTTRVAYVLISDSSGILRNPWASALLSLAWAIGATGAYLLERYDHTKEESE